MKRNDKKPSRSSLVIYFINFNRPVTFCRERTPRHTDTNLRKRREGGGKIEQNVYNLSKK